MLQNDTTREIYQTTQILKQNISRVIIGKDETIHLLIVALLCEGHVCSKMYLVLEKRHWQKRLHVR